MNLREAVLEAVESLSSNKLRSGLTVLGIVIGVGAVIAMLGIGRGAQASITGSISDIGTNLLFVFEGGADDVRNPRPLTLGDAQAISDGFQAPSVERVAPLLQGSVEVTYGGESTVTQGMGVTTAYESVRNVEMAEGEFLSEEHLLGRAAVAVIAPDTAERLFGRTEGLVGETIRIEGQPFRILGVTVARGGAGFNNEDDRVMVPLTTAQTRLLRRGRDEVDMILARAASADTVPQAQAEIAGLLRTRHRTPVGADDFTIFTQQDFLATAETITNVLTIFLGGIAAISLLVGGIGIMNIMLVSVTERTREIGLRKAIGARKRDILIQFLTESSLLSLIGGVIGVIFGYSLAMLVGVIARASDADLSPAVSLDAILMATLFSAAVGLFFGLYPAKRAADLEPVEALRYE
ncbi:MAG: putative transporter permease protein [Anaerolineales bacterium]|jgi:putative ABC transport system permease protein|nr:putative ABC transporter permease protein [Anaerolineales bacterium]MBM2843322.1 putative transporter permease protein [Anaerolineales bacterium]